MTVELATKLLEIAVQNQIEAELYNGGYSGRGMFGKTTIAIVVPSRDDLNNILLQLPNEPEFLSELKALRTDNLGRDLIAY
jgi:hypothetical protein